EHRDARVAHHDVDAAHRVERGVAQVLDVGILRHVAVHAEIPPTQRLDLGTTLVDARVVDVGDDDVGATARELERSRSADAAGSAGDHRDRAIDLHQSSPSTTRFHSGWLSYAACANAPKSAPFRNDCPPSTLMH